MRNLAGTNIKISHALQIVIPEAAGYRESRGNMQLHWD